MVVCEYIISVCCYHILPQHILSREENWNAWKNESCPSFIREPRTGKRVDGGGLRRKRSLGDDLKASRGKIIKMGNTELTRLWNLCPDNMEACRIAASKYASPNFKLLCDALIVI